MDNSNAQNPIQPQLPPQFTQEEMEGFDGLRAYDPDYRRLEITREGVLEVNNLPPEAVLQSEHIIRFMDVAFAYAQDQRHQSPSCISVADFFDITAQVALDVLEKISALNLVLEPENTITGFDANESKLNKAAMDIIVSEVSLGNFRHLDISGVEIEGFEGEVGNSHAIKDFALALIGKAVQKFDLYITETWLTKEDSDAIVQAAEDNPNVTYDNDGEEIIDESEPEVEEAAEVDDRNGAPSSTPERKKANIDDGMNNLHKGGAGASR